jgi:DNA-binding IscR family transcriptional regulator
LLDLKRGGYVQANKGSAAATTWFQEPKSITLADIYRFFDGAIALSAMCHRKFHEKCEDCRDEDLCDLKPALAEIRDKTFEVMSKITLESLLRNPRKLSQKARS